MEDIKPKKRNHKRAILIAMAGFAVFSVHVFMSKGSSEFVQGLLHGDFIYISNLVMTTFVISGWFLVYKFLGRLL